MIGFGPPRLKDLMRGLPIHAELSVAELRALARRQTRPRVAPRFYAIAHVLDGASRAEAARLCGMDCQALRDAVVRFDAEGLGGLVDRPGRGGASPRTRPTGRTPGVDCSSGTISLSHTVVSRSGRHRPCGALHCDGDRGSALSRAPVLAPMPAQAATSWRVWALRWCMYDLAC